MYIKRIKLRNIRGFRELDLDISEERRNPRMRTMIIGKNGTCKTTLLRSIAIGLCRLGDSNALLAEPNGQLVSEGARSAEIHIEVVSRNRARKRHTYTTILERRKDYETAIKKTGTLPREQFFICAYGAGRSSEGPETGRAYRIVDSTYTLFNYDQTLIHSELVLRRLKDFLGTQVYENTMRRIRNVLHIPRADRIYVAKGGGVLIAGPSTAKPIPLEGWADGYRKTFNWILDLYGWALRAKALTESGDIRGIILIDELEQHMHPSMQPDLLDLLGQLLPRVQVFVTTHSPLVILGARPEDVVVLRRQKREVFVDDRVPNFAGYSAEDVLKDEDLFATEVYSSKLITKLDEYRKLAKLSKAKISSTKKKRLKQLAKELEAQQLIQVEDTPLLKQLKNLRKELGL